MACSSAALAQIPDPDGLDPTSDNHGRFVSAAMTDNGNPLIAYQDQSSFAGMAVTLCQDSQCLSRGSRLLDPRGSSNSAGAFTRLSIAPDGRPIIAHLKFGPGGGLRVYRCTTGNCVQSMTEFDSVNSVAVGSFSIASIDAAVGADNQPVISAFLQSGAIAQGLWIIKCPDSACGSGFTASQVAPDRAESGRLSSLAVGADGFPVVAFQDRSNSGSNGQLAVLKCNDPACSGQDESIVVLEPLGGSVDRPIDLTLNAAGNPVIAFADPLGFLRVITCNDPACAGGDHVSNRVLTEAVTGFAVSIVLDERGFPVLAAHGFASESRNIEVIACNDALCAGDDERTTVLLFPTAADITLGRYLDLVIASNGEPFLAYSREQRLGPSQFISSARVASCVSEGCVVLFDDSFE